MVKKMPLGRRRPPPGERRSAVASTRRLNRVTTVPEEMTPTPLRVQSFCPANLSASFRSQSGPAGVELVLPACSAEMSFSSERFASALQRERDVGIHPSPPDHNRTVW